MKKENKKNSHRVMGKKERERGGGERNLVRATYGG